MADFNTDGIIKVEVFVIPIIYGPDYEDYSVISYLLLKIIPQVTTQVVEAWYKRKVPVGVKLLYELDPEPEPGPEVIFRARVTAHALHVRKGPGSHFNITGARSEGEILDVYQVVNGWYKIHKSRELWSYGRYTQTLP